MPVQQPETRREAENPGSDDDHVVGLRTNRGHRMWQTAASMTRTIGRLASSEPVRPQQTYTAALESYRAVATTIECRCTDAERQEGGAAMALVSHLVLLRACHSGAELVCRRL